MAELTVLLNDDERAFVEAEAADRGCASAEAFVRDLIHQERRRQAHKRLGELALEGLASGPGVEATPEYWDAKLARLAERYPGEAGT
jgi:antitoxin ParD1/3/4